MNEQLKKYDEICALALNWLIWNIRSCGRKRFCFINVNPLDNADLWLLSVIGCINGLLRGQIFIRTNFLTYLRLKYVQGFKFLRYSFSKKNIFELDAKIFETEVLNVFEETPEILEKIYYEYYRR